MSSLSNHSNGEIQPRNEESNETNNHNRTDQVTFQCTACNLRSFTTYHGLNQHLRSCLKKSREVSSVISSSQPTTSRTNIRGNNMNEVRRFL